VGRGRGEEFAALGELLHTQLDAVNAAREVALDACRRTIRACGSSIRAVQQRDPERAASFLSQAAATLAAAQTALAPFPAVAASGPLHDAEKEFSEANLTAALVAGRPLPSPAQLGVGIPAWLGGLAEAATELRRYLLDRLREGALGEAESILAAMDDVYDLLTGIDYPDALTGGLRRHVDALRAVLERTRGDLTISLLQHRLEAAIGSRLPRSDSLDGTPGV
jgi:translin